MMIRKKKKRRKGRKERQGEGRVFINGKVLIEITDLTIEAKERERE